MFRLVTGDIDRDLPDLAERIYRFRHGFFVDHLGWEACRKPDGRERDQFDSPHSIHIVGEEHGEIISYARLLPTTRPHLVTEVYPQIMQGAPSPAGPRIYEWTRHAVSPKKREAKGPSALTRAAFAAVARAVEILNLDGLLVQTHPVLVDRVMDMGWDVEPLALPATYDGALLLPIYARLVPQTLTVAQAAFSAHGSDLEATILRVPSPPTDCPAIGL
ncbi:acyl-homoserine-lactone synthase [Methylobacterium sp. NPDC080182]|uniref:acyl-homoserine-lactone synthase n=1 Tax=Methylobacterium sp. NPDC080182 TaxID=3390590 RepID=UPI003D03BCC5